MSYHDAVRQYEQQRSALDLDRSSFVPHWKDLSQHILPRRRRFDKSERNWGTKLNTSIINNTGTWALRVLASGMMAGMTSPARPWFRLMTPNPEMMSRRPVRMWLSEVETILRTLFARSNVYQALAGVYTDLGCYHTAAMFLGRDDKDVMRAHVWPIGSYWLSLDKALRVDTAMREVHLTARQILDEFNEGDWSRGEFSPNIPTVLKTAIKKNLENLAFTVIQVIEPNTDRVLSRADARGMPIRSVWYLTEGDTTKFPSTTGMSTFYDAAEFLRVGGYRVRPVVTPRWDVVGEDTYGSMGPAMDALGDVRALQVLERRKLQVLEKVVRPPMKASSGMRSQRTSIMAGDVTFTAAGNDVFEPAHLVDSRAAMIRDEIMRHEERIKSTFYADLFLMLATQPVSSRMTAREVDERHDEKMLQLGPALERQQNELLDPLIDRAFDIANAEGYIPPAPPEIRGAELRVEHISLLAQAQKMVNTVGVDRLLLYAQGLAQVDPSVIDKLDGDQGLEHYADLLGTDPALLRSDAEVAQIREQRAMQQQQSLDSARALQAGARAAKDLATVPAGEETALGAALRTVN